MANWISSKLKAAETILQQIDQQAAESLRKNENIRLEEQATIDAPAKSGSSTVSLKKQLKKKLPLPDTNDYHGKLRSDPNFTLLKTIPSTAAPKLSPKSTPDITDGDWTQLLSSPAQPIPSPSGGNHGNGLPAPRLLRQNSRKLKSLSVSDVKTDKKSGNTSSRSLHRLDSVKGVKLSDDGRDSTSSGSTDRQLSVELETDSTNSSDKPLVEANNKPNEQHESGFDYRDSSSLESLQQDNKLVNAKTTPELGVDQVHGAKIPVGVGGQLRSAIKPRRELNSVSANSTLDDLKRGVSMESDGSSDSDIESGSSSDSESEHEREERRKKRERILAERAAAKAINTIKEKENMVAKLEGEKQSLEKILEERAKQQAQEVIL